MRKADAFRALVPIEKFFQVREIIAQRSSHYEDDQLLGMLRQLLAKHGALSGLMIDEEEALPSSSAFRSRFGSLLRAYRLVGYTPARDYAYLEINRALREMHPTIVENMSRQIQAAGGHVQPHGNTGLLLVNGEFTASPRSRSMQANPRRLNALADEVRERPPARRDPRHPTVR